MKKLNLLWAVLLLLTACGKDPLPTDAASTTERQNNGITYIMSTASDGSELYFKVLSDNTAEVVGAEEYFDGIEPPFNYVGKAVVIPSELTHDSQSYTIVGIGDYAFYRCWNMTSVEIPTTVEYIGDHAFETTQIKSIELHDGISRIGASAFSQCNQLTSIELGPLVTCVSDHAFYDCHNMTSIIMPNVDTIKSSAFAYVSKLETIELPATTKLIERAAFFRCTSLKTVVCRAVTPPVFLDNGWGEDPFDDSPIQEIKVPAESVDAYKTAVGWRARANQIVGM